MVRCGLKSKNYVIVDAPLLIEAGLAKMCNDVVLVVASKDRIFRRIGANQDFFKERIEKRTKAQMSITKKMKFADYIVKNNGTKKELKNKLNELVKSNFLN